MILLVTSFFPPDTKKSIVAERKALDTNCRDNNDEFKVKKNKHKTPSKYTQTQTQTARTTTLSSRFKTQAQNTK